MPEAPRSQQSPAGAELHLVVNGESRAVEPGCTLQGLVESLGLDRGRVAVAVNRDVVPRSAFVRRRLAAGDQIEILEAVGGG